MILNVIVGMLVVGFVGFGVCLYSIMRDNKVKTINIKRVNSHASSEYRRIYNEKIKGYKEMNEVERTKATYDILTDFSGTIADLHYENINLNNKLEEMNNTFKEQMKEINTEIKSLKEENKYLKCRIYNLERENSGQSKYITNVVDKLKNASLNVNKI